MLADLKRIGAYVAQYGWRYEERPEDVLVTGFRGKAGTFRIFVQVAEPWVLLAIVPFVPRPTPACRERFYRSVLQLNFDMNLCKIGADADEDIALSLELRAEDLRFADLAAGLDALAYYADAYYLPLLNLSRDPNAALPELART